MNLFFCAAILIILFTAVFISCGGLSTGNISVDDEMAVIVVPNSVQECEFIVRMAAEKMKWTQPRRGSRLICLNMKEDEEINFICSCLSQRYPFLSVSNCADLGYNIMQGNFKVCPIRDSKE